MKKISKSKKRRRSFIKKGNNSVIQHRHVVGPKDYRKPKYMRDPDYDQSPVTLYVPKK